MPHQPPVRQQSRSPPKDDRLIILRNVPTATLLQRWLRGCNNSFIHNEVNRGWLMSFQCLQARQKSLWPKNVMSRLRADNLIDKLGSRIDSDSMTSVVLRAYLMASICLNSSIFSLLSLKTSSNTSSLFAPIHGAGRAALAAEREGIPGRP